MKNEKNKKPDDGARIKSPEDLIAFSQEYYSKDFSNPESEGCTAPGMARTMVESGTLPDDEIRQHLFNCSNCFLEFREAMAAYKKAPGRQVTLWLKSPIFDLKPRFSWALAAAALLFIITALGIALYKFDRNSQLTTVAQKSPEQTTGPANVNGDRPVTLIPKSSTDANAEEPTSSPRPKSQTRRASRGHQDLIAAVYIKVDLREDVMRSAEEAQNREEKVIELPASRANLSFNLPNHSSKGIYEVKIVDAFGKLLKSAKGMSRDGKTLRVLLDLRGLEEARCRLCVSHENEAPDCYQIVINNRTVKQ